MVEVLQQQTVLENVLNLQKMWILVLFFFYQINDFFQYLTTLIAHLHLCPNLPKLSLKDLFF